MHRLRYVALALGLATCPQLAGGQIAPNSSFFSVQDYYVPNGNGDYVRYRVAGFAQPPAPGITPALFVLPTVSVSPRDVRFSRPNGTQFTPTSYDTVVGSITVTPRVVTTMPSAVHIPGIAAVLSGQSIEYYPRPGWRGANNQIPMRMDAAMSPMAMAITEDYQAWDRFIAGIDSLAQRYRGYQARMAALNQVEVHLMIAGEKVASRSYPGTTTSLGAITVLNPTTFQVNQMLEGQFELLVSARFPDMRTSYISARFDARQALKSFVSETQNAITKSKSSGFQVFHLGSRRSKMTTSISQSIRTSDTLQQMQATTVVMYDATDEMVRQFENDFFPELAREDVIDRHLRAADSARAAGNLGLAQVHQDYAAAITQANQLKEVDAVAAAAALNNGDYAGFLAQGVRSINSNDTKANNFRRLETREVEISQKTAWDQTRQVSVLRETSLPVGVDTTIRQRPSLGVCGMRMGVPYTSVVRDQWGNPSPRPVNGIVLSCVTQGSPLAAANILPGTFVYAVGVEAVSSAADFIREVDKYEPGDLVSLWVIEPTPGSPFTREVRYQVRANAGSPRPQ